MKNIFTQIFKDRFDFLKGRQITGTHDIKQPLLGVGRRPAQRPVQIGTTSLGNLFTQSLGGGRQ